ncbi:MAG: acyl-CoA dehydrogenase family protein [Bacteriovorax sp.]
MENVFEELGEALISKMRQVERTGKKEIDLMRHLPEILTCVNDLKEEELLLWLYQAKKIKKRRAPEFPKINGDFYYTRNDLHEDEVKILENVRKFMLSEIEPIATEYWMKGEFPFPIIDQMKKLNIVGLTYDKSYGGAERSNLLEGMIAEEMARVDVSTCTFFGVHSGLAMNSIYYCGSEDQKREFIPKMIRMDKLGAFALTEPEIGSAASFALKTTCKREGDTWRINGEKKWIGNATFADYIIVWAKDVDDHQVKGFIVDRQTSGLTTKKIEDKMALRIVQNAWVTMKNVLVREERRLQKANSFKDTAKVLKMTRAGVAWQAVGCARGAYEHTLAYTMKRRQFDRPIAGFQMTQDLLSQMLSQLTAMQCLVSRLSQLQDRGTISDEQASLAKVFCTVGCRTITSMSRELMGANGILISNKVARFLGDAEALYSYEGTKQINSLVLGRAITGLSAFI